MCDNSRRSLAEHYSTKGWLQRVEQCVFYMDISSMDFNLVLALAEACLIGNHIGIGLKVDVNCIFRVRGEDSLELLKDLKCEFILRRFQRETINNAPQSNASQPRNNVSVGAVKNSFVAVLKSINIKPSIAIKSSFAIVLDDSCLQERFENVNLSYLGGLLVLIEMDSMASKEKISKHVGVASWFYELIPVCNSFVREDRIVWISIEGLPIKAFTRNSFAKIVSPWGELTDVEDSENKSLSFISALKEDISSSDDESEGDYEENKTGNNMDDFNLDKEDELDYVSESNCMRENGFTPNVVMENVLETNLKKISQPKNIMFDNNEGVIYDKSGSSLVSKFKASGSILEVMDELITVGQTMGYNMEGCMKNIETIIGSQRDCDAVVINTPGFITP
ncbi:RNA-directed DNA polymerase, eukaryota [Tanacetum coccineum]